jgi:hypothetical protein
VSLRRRRDLPTYDALELRRPVLGAAWVIRKLRERSQLSPPLLTKL